MSPEDKINQAQALNPKLAKYLEDQGTENLKSLRIASTKSHPDLLESLQGLCETLGIKEAPHILISKEVSADGKIHRRLNTIEMPSALCRKGMEPRRDLFLARNLIQLHKEKKYNFAIVSSSYIAAAAKAAPTTAGAYYILTVALPKIGVAAGFSAPIVLATFTASTLVVGTGAKVAIERLFRRYNQFAADAKAVHMTGSFDEALQELQDLQQLEATKPKKTLVQKIKDPDSVPASKREAELIRRELKKQGRTIILRD